ncbi:hyaluronan mediated motility receptor isoform X2 [Pleurodeles waltl]|uniref:hyaluronan mediated motility receptor isoform X2 n=1 Tax=Pleurodeles waltl TaxID=8319 RepID=UPI00370944C0
MSFPKAPIKRFNEHVGCAPAPGSYDVKDRDGIKGATSFPKSQRFQKSKDDGTGSTQSLDHERDMSSPTRSRKPSSLGSTPNLSRKSEKDSDFVRELKKQKSLEKEIRALVKERGEQDKQLHDLGEEFKKTEAKLTATVREKSALAASIVSLERQLADLQKANELMKAKFSDDSTKKKINALCVELMEAKNKLELKDKELSSQQINFEEQIKVLHIDLEASKTTSSALQEKNKYLEYVHQEGKLQSEELVMEMDKLHALIKELRAENKTLHGYLSDSQEQIQEIRLQMNTKTVEFENAMKMAKLNMEKQIQLLTAKHEDVELNLQEAQKDLEAATVRETLLQEKLVATDQAKEKLAEEKAETEKKLLEHLAEMNRVSEQVEIYKLELAQSEQLLKAKDQSSLTQKNNFLAKEAEFSEQIKDLKKRCQALQQEKECLTAETQEKEQTLQAEVDLLKQKLQQEEQGSQMLLQKQNKLVFSLQQAEELAAALREELLQVEEEMRTEKSLLEEELEGTLDELDRMQLEEEHAEKLITHLEQENKQRSEELNRLELMLKEKNAELEKVNMMHNKAKTQFEEERQTTLCKLNEMTVASESYKVSVSAEIESLKYKNSSLLEKVVALDTSVLDKDNQLQEIQRAAAQADEEFSRMLLDAQTTLATKESELKQAAESHLAAMDELRRQLEQKQKALEKLCEEMHSLRRNSIDENVVVQLKEEIQKWRTLYEELHQKVKPFQQQLDMFEAEKNALLNEHGAAQDELNKLSEAYAKLLGHQNQKQKIKHVMKLKEENIQLKQRSASTSDFLPHVLLGSLLRALLFLHTFSTYFLSEKLI